MRSTITITINHPDELAPNGVTHELDGLAEVVRAVCDRVRLDGTVVIAIAKAGSLTDREIEVARYVLACQRAERDGHRASAPKAGLLTAEELRELRGISRRSSARAERLER